MVHSEGTRPFQNGAANIGQRTVSSGPRPALHTNQLASSDQAEFVFCEQTILAVSSPIMVMLIVDGSLCWFKRPALWHTDAVGSRPPHLSRLAQGATSRRRTLLAGTGRGGQRDPDAKLAAQLALAR